MNSSFYSTSVTGRINGVNCQCATLDIMSSVYSSGSIFIEKLARQEVSVALLFAKSLSVKFTLPLLSESSLRPLKFTPVMVEAWLQGRALATDMDPTLDSPSEWYPGHIGSSDTRNVSYIE